MLSAGGIETFQQATDEDLHAFAVEGMGTTATVTSVSSVWIDQGPAPAINGQVENVSPNDEVSGAVHTVVAHPTDADVLWVGSVNGGIWRTDNATAASTTWRPQTDNLQSLSIGAMELDPTDPTADTLVAGIGRYSSFGQVGDDHVGILRTTDGGTSWVNPGSAGLTSPNISGVAARGNAIVVSVNYADPDTYSNIGIFRSTDGGANFSQVAGIPPGVAFDLASDPTNNATLYTGITSHAYPDGIYKSTDTGATWAKVSNAAMDALISDFFATNNIEISAIGNDVFANIIQNGRSAGIFYSADGAATWTAMDLPRTPEGSPTAIGTVMPGAPIVIDTSASGSHGLSSGMEVEVAGVGGTTGANGVWTITYISSTQFSLDNSSDSTPWTGGGTWQKVVGLNPKVKAGSQGWIHASIRQDPNSPTTVYMGGDRQDYPFPNMLGALDYSGRLFRGDPTVTATGAIPSPQWEHLTHSNSVGSIPGGGTANSSSPHADSREMVFDANGDLIEVDDAGVYRRTSPQNNTGDWFSINGNLQVTEQHDIAYDTISNIIISGNQDTGTTQQQSPGSLTWDSVHTADGGDVAVSVDPGNPAQSVRYSSYQNLGGFRRRVYDASNNLISQTYLPSVFGAQFVTPIAVNALDPNRLLIGGSGTLYESFDQGTSTAPVAGGGRTNRNAMAYGHQDNVDLIVIGSYNDVLLRTAFGSPMTATTTAFPGGTVKDVLVDPGAGFSNVFFVLDSSNVYATPDAGTTWVNITGNLGSLAGDFQQLEYIEAAPWDGLVVATDNGVFVSDASTSFTVWSELAAGLPNGLAYDLDYDLEDDVLVVGTMGRGAWMLPDAGKVVNGPTSDFGDAPDSYGTTLASSGAQHTAVGPVLGYALDTESDAGGPLDGTGDDVTGTTSDEDGVTIPGSLTPGVFNSVTVDVSNGPAYLNAWIDYNANGTFDTAAGEQIAVDLPVNSGSNTVTFVIPADATQGTTFARFRLSTAGGIGPTGPAADGEVEDYTVTIGAVFGILVAPTSGLTTTEAGGTARFTIFLGTEPTANVTIDLTSSDPGEGTVSPASVTFAPADWDTAQTVTVTGVDDALADGDVAYTVVTAPASSSDTTFNNLDADDVSVTNQDDDVSALTLTIAPSEVSEGAGPAATTATLSRNDADLSSALTVDLSSSDTSELTVPPQATIPAGQASVTFDLDAVDDALLDGTQTVTVTAIEVVAGGVAPEADSTFGTATRRAGDDV